MTTSHAAVPGDSMVSRHCYAKARQGLLDYRMHLKMGRHDLALNDAISAFNSRAGARWWRRPRNRDPLTFSFGWESRPWD